jgi:hypothetical protein
MVRKARERHGGVPKVEFEIADLQDGLPVSQSDPPCDIYFSSYGALSHLPDGAMRKLLEDICEHMSERAVFVADLLGRYSYEWPCYWNGHGLSPQMRPYSMEYVYSPEMLNGQQNGHFSLRYWGGEELDAFVQETVSARGVRVARKGRRYPRGACASPVRSCAIGPSSWVGTWTRGGTTGVPRRSAPRSTLSIRWIAERICPRSSSIIFHIPITRG